MILVLVSVCLSLCVHLSVCVAHVNSVLSKPSRREMQHFVTVMDGYVVNQIIRVSWLEFQQQLKEVQSSMPCASCLQQGS